MFPKSESKQRLIGVYNLVYPACHNGKLLHYIDPPEIKVYRHFCKLHPRMKKWSPLSDCSVVWSDLIENCDKTIMLRFEIQDVRKNTSALS